MNSHVEWFLAAFEEAGGLEQRIRETVGDHLFEVGVSSACLALACVSDHFPDLDLLPAVSVGFQGTRMTSEELDARAD